MKKSEKSRSTKTSDEYVKKQKEELDRTCFKGEKFVERSNRGQNGWKENQRKTKNWNVG